MSKCHLFLACVLMLSCRTGVHSAASPRLVKAPLTVDAHRNVKITADQVSTYLAIGSYILQTIDPPQGDDVATPIEFNLNRSLGHFSTGDGNVNGPGELQQLFAMPGDAHIVNVLAYCKGTKGGVLGCTNPYGPMVIFSDPYNAWSDKAKGVLWAHEYGHKQLLKHRNTATAVMAKAIDEGHTNVTPCERDHYLGDFSTTCPGTDDALYLKKVDVEIFVAGIFPEGVPYEAGSRYTATDIGGLVHVLNDCNQQLHWVNAVSVLGMIGEPSAFKILQAFLKEDTASRCPRVSSAAYLAKEIVPLSVGYIFASHNTPDIREFFQTGLHPSQWNTQISWKNPYHPNVEYRNARLTTMNILGLGLSGQKDAADSLRNLLSDLNAERLKNEIYEPDVIQILNEALQTNQHVRNVGLAQYYKDSELEAQK
jgi:hypothetical protein